MAIGLVSVTGWRSITHWRKASKRMVHRRGRRVTRHGRRVTGHGPVSSYYWRRVTMRLALVQWIAFLGLAAGGLVACQARTSAAPALGAGPLDSAGAYVERGDKYAAAQAYARALADYS